MKSFSPGFYRYGLGVGVLLICLSSVSTHLSSGPPKDLALTWIDVGRRLTLLIQTPEDKTLLVNPGPIEPSDTIDRILMPYLAAIRCKKVDAIILTASQPKPVSGFAKIARYFDNPKVVVCSNSDVSAWKTWQEKNKEAELQIISEGDTESWGDLTLEVLPGSKSFRTEAALLWTHKNRTFVTGHTLALRTQKALVEKGLKNIDLLQARFSDRIKWDSRFLTQTDPAALVETSVSASTTTTTSIWPEKEMFFPQRRGIWKFP